MTDELAEAAAFAAKMEKNLKGEAIPLSLTAKCPECGRQRPWYVKKDAICWPCASRRYWDRGGRDD